MKRAIYFFKTVILCFLFLLLGKSALAQASSPFFIGSHVMAITGGAKVRLTPVADPPLFTQWVGVHGIIIHGPVPGGITNPYYAGDWYQIQWDSVPRNQLVDGEVPAGKQGWVAQSRILLLAPHPVEVPEQIFDNAAAALSNHYYTTDQRDHLFPDWAPASVGGTKFDVTTLGNCTWYANGRMRELGYNSTQLDILEGNAGNWDAQARGAHIDVGSEEAVGSIAQWEPDPSSPTSLGHVAVVESLNDDGTITVTESSFFEPPMVNSNNATTLWNFLWRHRTISKAQGWPTHFIYVDRPIIAERYAREGGQMGANLPYLDVTDWFSSGGWDYKYRWFERGFIASAKRPSTGDTWTYAWSKQTNIWNASEDWVRLGWCEHVGVKTYCYAP